MQEPAPTPAAPLAAGPLRHPRCCQPPPQRGDPLPPPPSGSGAVPAVGARRPARGRGSPSPGAEGPHCPAPPPAAWRGGRLRRRLQRFPYIRGCPGPAAGKRAEQGILLPGSLLRAGCFALLKVPGLGKSFPFHSWPERLLPRREQS